MKKFSAACSGLDNLTAFVVEVVKLSEALLHCRKIIWKKVKVFSVVLSTAENILQISKLLY